MELGGKENIIPPAMEGPAHNGFRLALRIDVRGIDAGDTGVEGRMDDADAFLGARGRRTCPKVEGSQGKGLIRAPVRPRVRSSLRLISGFLREESRLCNGLTRRYTCRAPGHSKNVQILRFSYCGVMKQGMTNYELTSFDTRIHKYCRYRPE